MRRSDLEHLIRAAGRISGERELVIIGSQSVLGHLQVQGLTGHHQCDLHTAGTESQHAERAGRRGMAVTSDQRQAGLAEALHMHRMADAVAGTTVPDAEATAGAARNRCSSAFM